MKTLFPNKKGTSIIISLGIVCVFILLAASVASIVISQMRQGSGYIDSMMAGNAAESGLQRGLFELKYPGKLPPGDNTITLEYQIDDAIKEATAHWKIFDTVGANKKFEGGEFSYPIPGTGTAGETCDPFNPVVKGQSTSKVDCEKLQPAAASAWEKLQCAFEQKGSFMLGDTGKSVGGGDTADSVSLKLSKYSPEDLPCNWNKVKLGETVQVPLYGKDGALDFINFKLRVRTPCKPVCEGEGDEQKCAVPELCESGERYGLVSEPFPSPLPSADPLKSIAKSKTAIKDILVMWSIEDGKCAGGVLCFLSNMTNVVNNQADYENKQKVSLITAQRVNEKKDSGYAILDETSTGLKDANPSTTNYILSGPKDIFLSTSLSDTSYFKLSYIKQATSNDVFGKPNVPYLEYQLLYKATEEKSITVSDPLVVSEGSAGGFKQTLKARYSPKTGIINYVIQQ